MMKYPTHEVYEKLYLKYINDPGNVQFLMNLAGADLFGKIVLDLCCGNGIVTEEALKRKARHVYMVDQEREMIPLEKFGNEKDVSIYVGTVEEELGRLECRFRPSPDIVICRQAINYWMDEKTILSLSRVLKSGGIFVFNTFNTCPPETPLVKQYKIDEKSFVEISYLAYGRTIHHVQIREGMAPHLTEFLWMSPSWLELVLSPYFAVERITVGKTDYYKCVKK